MGQIGRLRLNGEASRGEMDMRSEREKMLAGELYNPLDAELVVGRETRPRLVPRFECDAGEGAGEAAGDFEAAVWRGGDDVWMQPPFFCDYGMNIRLGKKCVIKPVRSRR